MPEKFVPTIGCVPLPHAGPSLLVAALIKIGALPMAQVIQHQDLLMMCLMEQARAELYRRGIVEIPKAFIQKPQPEPPGGNGPNPRCP